VPGLDIIIGKVSQYKPVIDGAMGYLDYAKDIIKDVEHLSPILEYISNKVPTKIEGTLLNNATDAVQTLEQWEQAYTQIQKWGQTDCLPDFVFEIISIDKDKNISLKILDSKSGGLVQGENITFGFSADGTNRALVEKQAEPSMALVPMANLAGWTKHGYFFADIESDEHRPVSIRVPKPEYVMFRSK
jgi:hypothetical protein